MSLYCDDSARQLARAEADYLRAPEERDPRCPCCVEAYDADEGEELDAAGAAHAGLPAGEIVCPGCAAKVREDIASIAAHAALGALRHVWSKRSEVSL